MIEDLIPQLLTAQFLRSALALTVPLGFAALGGIICERAGVINLGLEGMLLLSAFASVWAAVATDSLAAGVLAGAAASALLGLLHAFLSVSVRMNQIISGIAINLLALGLTGFLFRLLYAAAPTAPRMRSLPVPGLAEIPVVGPALFNQTLLFYLLFPTAAAVFLFLFRTRAGLTLRTVGESAASATTLGIRVVAIRYAAVVIGGFVTGIGGVFIALVHVGTFTEGMTGGKGFIAFAVVIFSGWRPGRALAAALLFGAIEAMAFRVQVVNPAIPFQLVLMLPHLVTVVMFSLLGSLVRSPGDLGRPLPVT
jgi:general nucleoside transport system permease protein